ncbi:MAG TPA: hypothetical protein VNQ73_02525 [Ilumatobacter sp.]|nr:hypothetical protein [Ilumatobacter sp.]
MPPDFATEIARLWREMIAELAALGDVQRAELAESILDEAVSQAARVLTSEMALRSR